MLHWRAPLAKRVPCSNIVIIVYSTMNTLPGHTWTHKWDIGENIHVVMFMLVLLVQMYASSDHDMIESKNTLVNKRKKVTSK